MDTIKLYFRSMGMLLKSQLQYPASFFMQALAQLVMEGGEMLAVILLVDRFDRLNQWMPGDLYFFFGLMSVSFYLTELFGRGITGAFPSMVRSGQLDTLFLRPRGVQAMLNLLMMTLSGNILPLTLFPDSWQKVVTLLPYAQLLDAPIRLYTGEYAVARAGEILLIQSLWCAALILLGRFMWRQNQRRLIIQGG